MDVLNSQLDREIRYVRSEVSIIQFQLMEEEDGEREMTDLQKEIDAQLEKDNSRRRKAAASATPTSILGVGKYCA